MEKKDLPFGVYLLGSAVVAIAAVSLSCLQQWDACPSCMQIIYTLQRTACRLAPGLSWLIRTQSLVCWALMTLCGKSSWAFLVCQATPQQVRHDFRILTCGASFMSIMRIVCVFMLSLKYVVIRRISVLQGNSVSQQRF